MNIMNKTLTTFGLIALVASSAQAMRMVSAEDTNVIPGAAYYIIHGKNECIQNDAFERASILGRTSDKHHVIQCHSHKVVKPLLKKHKNSDARIITYHDAKHTPLVCVELPSAEMLGNPRVRLDITAKPVVACVVITKHIKSPMKIVTLYDSFNNVITSDWDVNVFEYKEQQVPNYPHAPYKRRIRIGFTPEIAQALDVRNCIILDKTTQGSKKLK